MKNLSLKLNEDIFNETEKLLIDIKINRNKYINEAIDYYNKAQKRKLLATKLAFESKLVAKDSLSVLLEFESLEDGV